MPTELTPAQLSDCLDAISGGYSDSAQALRGHIEYLTAELDSACEVAAALAYRDSTLLPTSEYWIVRTPDRIASFPSKQMAMDAADVVEAMMEYRPEVARVLVATIEVVPEPETP